MVLRSPQLTSFRFRVGLSPPSRTRVTVPRRNRSGTEFTRANLDRRHARREIPTPLSENSVAERSPPHHLAHLLPGAGCRAVGAEVEMATRHSLVVSFRTARDPAGGLVRPITAGHFRVQASVVYKPSTRDLGVSKRIGLLTGSRHPDSIVLCDRQHSSGAIWTQREPPEWLKPAPLQAGYRPGPSLSC